MKKILTFYSKIEEKNLEQKLKHAIIQKLYKIPFVEMIELPVDYDHSFIKKYLGSNKEIESHFFYDYRNINSLSLLAGFTVATSQKKIHLFIDDLFFETALRLDSLPLSSLAQQPGNFLYPSSAHATYADSFFLNQNSQVLPWPSLASSPLATQSLRQKTRQELEIPADDFCIVIPLAQQRDSNILFLLDTLKEAPSELQNRKIHFLLCLNDEIPNIASLPLKLPSGLLYQEIQEKISTFPSKSWNFHFLENFSENHVWAADLYLDLSTSFPAPLRLEVSLAQDCGLPILISSWGCCKKNIYQNSFSPLTVINTSLNRLGLQLSQAEIIYALSQLLNYPTSFEQRLISAQKSRDKRENNKFENFLNDIFLKNNDQISLTNWKLRYFYRSLQTPTGRFSSQEFLGHLYDNFQSPFNA